MGYTKFSTMDTLCLAYYHHQKSNGSNKTKRTFIARVIDPRGTWEDKWCCYRLRSLPRFSFASVRLDVVLLF